MSASVTPNASSDPGDRKGANDSERALLREGVRRFLAQRNSMARVRELRDQHPGFQRTFWKELAELGCIGALLPSEYGGTGLQLADMVALMLEFGPALIPEPIVATAVGVAGLLALVPDSELAARLSPQIAGGTVIPGLAWQEWAEDIPGSACTVSAPLLNGCIVLDGQRRFVLPAYADGFLLTAIVGTRSALCWLPTGSPGLALGTESRIDGTVSGVLQLSSVRVTPHHFAMSETLDCAAIGSVVDDCNLCVAAELLGIAETTLAHTLEYLRTREQFGRPIGANQALQHRAVDLYVKQELARAALDAATEALSHPCDPRQRAIHASRAKVRAIDAALTIGREAVQMHGAMGFADECDIGLYLKRALVLAAWLGNGTAHRRRIERLQGAQRLEERDTESVAPRPSASDIELPEDWNALADDVFRLQVRTILEREYPPGLRNPPQRLTWRQCQAFYQKMSRYGLLALAWPKEFGGAGLSAQKQIIFMEEQDRWGVARAPDMGITMVGPALIHYGSSAQRERYLGPILKFDHMWCQGFSEPNAGSDLANLNTQAQAQGEFFVIDGSKIWTTFAQDATHMFLLARTARKPRKQDGISVFLLDMSTPGISVRPIRDMAGQEAFCEVRFDQVRVGADCVLGAVDAGWCVAKMLLSQERFYLGNPRQAHYAFKRLEAVHAQLGLTSDPVFAARLTQLGMDVYDLGSLYKRFANQVRRGDPLGSDVSILKLFGSETYQRISQFAIESIGCSGGLSGETPLGNARIDTMSLCMNALPSTIYGGSNEVQRNVLAKQILRLPGTV